MTWLRRKSVRVLGLLLGVLLLSILGVRVFLPAEKVRDLALAQAWEKLGREVSVGDVAVSLRGGLGVRLTDFALHNPDGFAGDHLVTARSLDLKLAIRPLLKGEIRLHRLVLEAPSVNLVRRADGGDNFTFGAATAAAPEEETPAAAPVSAPASISVASLTLEQGRVLFVDEMAAEGALQGLQLGGLSLELSLTDPAPGRYQAQGRLAVAEAVLNGPASVPVLKGTADFDLTWDAAASRLEVIQGQVHLNNLPLTCVGALVTAGDAPTGQFQIRVDDRSLLEILAFAPPELAGKISGDANSGRLSAAVDVNLTGAVNAPWETSGQVTVRGADLSLAQPFLPADQTGRLAGRQDVQLNFTTQTGDTRQFLYDGTFRTEGLSYTGSGLVDELQNLDATGTFTPDEFTLESCRARFASGTLELTGRLRDPFPYFLPPDLQGDTVMKTPHLTFDLQAPRLDVDRLMPAASPTGRPPAAEDGPRPVPVPSDLEFPDLSCEGTFQADTLIYLQVPFTAVSGRVDLQDKQVHVTQVQGEVYQGRVAGQVDIDLQDLQDPAYAGSYQASDIEIDHFVTRFAGLAGVVFGGCDMGGDFSARGLDPEVIRNSLTLASDAAILHGRVVTAGNVHTTLSKLADLGGQNLAHEQTLKDLATHLSVENGRVGLSGLTTRLGQFGDLTVDGSYAFNGDLDYGGRLQLTAAQTARLWDGGGLFGELGKLLGTERPERLEIPLSLGGSRSEPRLKLDLGAVTGDLQQRAAQAQGRKLEDEAKSKLQDLLKKWK